MASWILAISALLVMSGCALRNPTVARFHEASAGAGGLGGMRTGSEFSPDDEARYGTGKAMLWRLSYARCLDKDAIIACIESPVDILPHTAISSLSSSAPRSYSSLLITPGVRLRSKRSPGGFLPVNYFSIGAGPARYVASRLLLNGTTAANQQRTTTWVIRGELGIDVHVTNRLGLRSGVLVQSGGLPAWFKKSAGVVPEGAHFPDERVGGHVLMSIRF